MQNVVTGDATPARSDMSCNNGRLAVWACAVLLTAECLGKPEALLNVRGGVCVNGVQLSQRLARHARVSTEIVTTASSDLQRGISAGGPVQSRCRLGTVDTVFFSVPGWRVQREEAFTPRNIGRVNPQNTCPYILVPCAESAFI